MRGRAYGTRGGKPRRGGRAWMLGPKVLGPKVLGLETWL